MQISLTPKLAAIVERQITSGAYSNPDEVIAAALLQFDEVIDLDVEAQIDEENERRSSKFKETGHTIAHEKVREWVYSLGTDNPLSCPK